MAVEVILPTRGRPDQLRIAIKSLVETSTEPDTKILIGADHDDPNTLALRDEDLGPVNWVVANREDTLGEKVERIYRHSTGDVLPFSADDMEMTTDGWDKILLDGAALFPDGIALLYFDDDIHPGFASNPAPTREWCRAFGYYMPVHFPFWWIDTWLNELGELTLRKYRVPVKSKPQNNTLGKTQNMRETSWWGEFFDRTRPERMAHAERLVHDLYPPYMQAVIFQQWETLVPRLIWSNKPARDCTPEIEANKSQETGEPDARYMRAKAKAVQHLIETGQ